MHSLIPYLRRQGSDLTPQQLRMIERELNELAALRDENASLKEQLAAAQADRTPKRAAKESAA